MSESPLKRRFGAFLLALLLLPGAVLAQGTAGPAAPLFSPAQTLTAAALNAALAAPTITGGSINGSIIGASNAQTGRFTGLTVLGPLTTTGTDAWVVGDVSTRKTFRHVSFLSPSAGVMSPLFLVDGNAFGTITSSAAVATLRAFNVNSDTVNASLAQGGGLTHNYFGSTVSAGSVGGRTNVFAFLLHQGSAPGAGNKFHVALSGFAESTGSAGGVSGTPAGNLFGLNTSALLRTGSGLFFEQVVGAEINVGAQTGTGVLDKVGLQIVQWDTDAVAASRSEIGLLFAAQVYNQVIGWRQGIAFGAQHGSWPMHPDGALISLGEQAKVLPARYPMVVARGVDFASVPAKFTATAFASPGFSVDGTGQVMLGSNTIGWSGTGLSLGAAGRVGTLSSIAAGGTGYRVGDIVRGPDGGVYEVATVSAGAITALTTIKAPTITSGAAPSNPRTLAGGMGTGATINLTWALADSIAIGTGVTVQGTALRLTQATPASGSAACTAGTITFDSAFIYTCTATNTWRRAATSSF